jgi:uncharacterized phage protein (TIGR01671 family)
MREIKFRTFIKAQKFMAIQGEPDVETLSSFMFHYANEKHLMQYTGLKDKNGTDIYEGDICKSSIKEKLFVIEYRTDEEYVGFIPVEVGKKGISRFVSWNDLEIIGNIYENKELSND